MTEWDALKRVRMDRFESDLRRYRIAASHDSEKHVGMHGATLMGLYEKALDKASNQREYIRGLEAKLAEVKSEKLDEVVKLVTSRPAQATETPEWHAGFNAAVEAHGMLEQAGETVDAARILAAIRDYSDQIRASEINVWSSDGYDLAEFIASKVTIPAVPDTPGVETRDVELTVTEYAEISFDNGDVEFLDGPTDERLSNDTHYRTVAYGPWRPVPAQPSTEPSCEREFAPAVPDAPGVVTRDVFVVLERNGDFDHVQYSQSHADEIVNVYPDRSYVPATLSYRHPVPAQPSLTDVILSTGRVAFAAQAEEIAAAVRAAFPELNEGNN